MSCGTQPPAQATIGEIRRSIEAALAYLARHQHTSGQFTYLYDPVRPRPGQYNLLRHAGTTEIVFRLVGSSFDTGHLSAVAQRGWDHLARHLLASRDGGATRICLGDDHGVAKLGGAALALWALGRKIQRSPARSDEDLSVAEGLARYLQSQQKADGSFTAKLDLRTGSEIPFASTYYPGQAVLALCTGFAVSGQASFLQSAIRGALRLLADGPQADADVSSCDHWLMIALARLHILSPQPWWRAGLRRLAGPVVDTVMSATSTPPGTSAMTTTQMTTRLEALAAALEIEQSGDEHAVIVRKTLLTGLSWCYRRQVGAEHPLHGDWRAQGGFTQSPTKTAIRIDYVQHAVSASIGAIDAAAAQHDISSDIPVNLRTCEIGETA